MICSEVREHQRQNNGQIDMIWFNQHVATCGDCKATMQAAKIAAEESLNVEDIEGDEEQI